MAMAVLLAVMAWAQTTRPAPPASQPTSAASRPVVKIPQPAEFVALAAKARKIKAVYVKGAAIIETGKTTTRPAKSEQVGFEIWARPPAVKLQLATPDREVRVGDGKFVYTMRRPPGAEAQGRRRRVTATNFYHSLEVAAVVCDAATGYANLAETVVFAPADGEPKYAKTMPNLKWFRLAPVTKPHHHLLKGVKAVKVGISSRDGLMRVLVGRIVRDDKEKAIAIVFQTVRRAAVKDEDLKLPAAAAQAKWTDADTGRPVPAPRKIIAKPKP
jgi:hypothetical protein